MSELKLQHLTYFIWICWNELHVFFQNGNIITMTEVDLQFVAQTREIRILRFDLLINDAIHIINVAQF